MQAAITDCHGLRTNVRFGSKADMCVAKCDVRFTPNTDRESSHSRRKRSYPFYAQKQIHLKLARLHAGPLFQSGTIRRKNV
jgi:hypothetical protein